jgi:hypothetical protein
MAAPGSSKSNSSGLGKWLVLLLLGLLSFGAVKMGWAGYGWAQLKSRILPRDEAILEWVPFETRAIAVIDPHLFDLRALGSAQGLVRTRVERMRNDIKKATGVDLAFDVDKLVLTRDLVVMRGRFYGDKLADKLADYKYVRADYGGQTYLVRTGEDAVLVVDDFLLYGDEASIKAAVDAKGSGSRSKNEKLTERLSKIGWGQPLLVSVQSSGERPSLRSILTGTTGSRALTVGARGAAGLEVRGAIEAEPPSAAGELAKLLEEKRAGAAELLAATTGPELGGLLADVAKQATIQADTTVGQVNFQVHVSPESLAALLSAAERSLPLLESYKTARLFQLLVPKQP